MSGQTTPMKPKAVDCTGWLPIRWRGRRLRTQIEKWRTASKRLRLKEEGSHLTLSKAEFNHLVDLFNRTCHHDVVGVSYDEHMAIGKVIDLLRSKARRLASITDSHPLR